VYFIDYSWELARINMLKDVFRLIDVNTVIREGNRLCYIMPNVPEIRLSNGQSNVLVVVEVLRHVSSI